MAHTTTDAVTTTLGEILVDDEQLLGSSIDGRYELLEVLGSGGAGVVYRARHEKLGHSVALKLIRQGLTSSEIVLHRFHREARLLSELRHPNIVGLTDFGVHQGVPYYVMEWVRGETLAEHLGRGPVPREDAYLILRQVVRALAFAHEHGILHRDLKPGNIMLQRVHGEIHVKLLDFGLAKLATQERDEDEENSGVITADDPREKLLEAVENHPATVQITQFGMVLGTPAYMAPEQASGGLVTPASDVYSVGIVFYELLAGNPPFYKGTHVDLMRKHLTEALPPLDLDEPIAPELEALLFRCLEKVPAKRFANAAELLSAFEALVRTSHASKIVDLKSAPDDPEALAQLTKDSALNAARAADSTHTRIKHNGKESKAKSNAWWLVAMLASAVIAVVIALMWDSSPNDSTSSTSADESTSTNESETDDQVPAETISPEESTDETPDPLASETLDFEDLPPELEAIQELLEASDGVDRSAHRQARVYQRLNPDDPRPTLLLARDLAEKSSWTESVQRYRLALRRWPSATEYEPMLGDLLTAVERGEPGAGELVREAFGAQAREAVRQRWARASQRSERDALVSLGASLE